MKFQLRYLLPLALVGSALVSRSLLAQEPRAYPDKPVRIVVAFQAGSYTDVVARLLAERLSARFGGAFVVENRVGAGGNIGTEAVARSAPDGLTLLFVSIATHGVNPSLYKSLSYDAQKDFAPVSLTMKVPNLVIVHPSLPVKTLPELIAYAKARPGQLNYASSGIGTSQHVTGELFKALANVYIVHVPYQGSPAALTDLLAGRVEISFQNLPFVMQHVAKGDLRALAVTSEQRSSLMPTVPTGAQAGMPGLVATSWSGMVAPARTPAPIVNRLATTLQEIVQSPDMLKHFAENGAEPVGSTPEEFRVFIAAEIAKWRDILARAGVKAE